MIMSQTRFPADRRSVLIGLGAAALLPGCMTGPFEAPRVGEPEIPGPPDRPRLSVDSAFASPREMYGERIDDDFVLPAIPYRQIDPRFLRQLVTDPTGEKPGTIIVDTANRFLYLVRPGGEAIRYGVGIGREGFAWSGRAVIQWKKKWPTWTPPAEMIKRDPELEKYSAANGGMPPGLANPLGARALYIFKDGVDTLYRLHGSPEWSSIGKAVSSGCVRLINQDVIDLYERSPNKTPIVVM